MGKFKPEELDATYKAYAKCANYSVRLMAARARGFLSPPYVWGDNSHRQLICQNECLYPTCPFYYERNLEELRHNHRADYDEWIVGYYRELEEQAGISRPDGYYDIPKSTYSTKEYDEDDDLPF